MSMPWFRLYSRMVDDEKLRLLAFEDRWHFVALCCLKSDGLLDEPDSDLRRRKIAVKMGVQVRELEEIARRLQEVGLTDETMSPHGWEKLQYRSDNVSERVKKYRQKQKVEKVKRPCNVSVTAPDTDTDTETEELEAKASRASGDAPDDDPDDFSEADVVDSWNAKAEQFDLPKVVKLTEARRRAIRARKREWPDIGDWRAAFRNLGESPFLLGGGRTGWKADFDFFLQTKSFAKLVEGSYGQAH